MTSDPDDLHFDSASAGLESGPARGRNAAVAQVFDEIADVLEIKGEQPYRVNAYRVAARNVGRLQEPLEQLFAEGRLRDIRGIGPALEAKIVEYLSTGRLEYYERLKEEFPRGLVALLGVPGVGPTRARLLYERLNITSVGDLERAARDGRLLDVPGFGGRAAEALTTALDRMRERTTRHLISTGWDVALDIQGALLRVCPAARVEVAGSVRRMQETIGNLDLVAVLDGDPEPLLSAFVGQPNAVQVKERTPTAATVLLYGGLEVRLHVVPPASGGNALLWHTGSRAHVERLAALARERGWELTALGISRGSRDLLADSEEAAVYERLGLPWIPPELREDAGEVEAAQAGTLPRLVQLEDLKGDLHCHTNWTDGVQDLEQMALAACSRGYRYMAVTDHSQHLTVTRGLTPERLLEQRRLVNRLNHKLAPFVILLGTEMDILRDGRLDFSDEVLATLDYVSASVHSAFNQSREVMTDRIVRAISSPNVHTLNHPHGRILRRRESYEVDMQMVVETAARVGCALELNAQPDRLDLDGAQARRAKDSGVRFTLSSDAHATTQLDLVRYGIGTARRAWLTPDDILNTRPLTALRAHLSRRAAS